MICFDLIFSDTIKETIWIPREKYHKLLDDIRSFTNGCPQNRYSVKLLERIRGKVISFLIVNPGLKLYIREMTHLLCLAEQLGLDYFTEDMIFNSEVEREFDCWFRLHNVSLSRKWYSDEIETVAIREMKHLVVSTDASTYQGGVHIEFGDRPGHIIEMSISWAPHEAVMGIACKEILMVKKVLEQMPDVVGKSLTFKVDNTVAVNSFKNGGCRDLKVTRIHKEILEYAAKRRCHVALDWISTHLQAADAPSRNVSSHIDSRVNFSVRFALITCFPNAVDLFATVGNRVFRRYFSRYEEFTSDGIFVFDTTFSPADILYAYPPSSLYGSAINLLRRNPSCTQIMLIHEFGSNALIHYQASQHFHYRLLIGDRRNPCCLTTGKKLNQDGQTGDFFRNYGEPHRSWMYFRNVSVDLIRRFHHAYCQQRHPLALFTRHKKLRRVFRCWRMISHRNRCADFRTGLSQSCLLEHCRSSSPFCLRIEILDRTHFADSAN